MNDDIKNCKQLWYLSITSANGVGIQGYFLRQDEAEEIFNRYSECVGQQLVGHECKEKAFVFQDIIGYHSLKAPMFPYCTLREVSRAEVLWKDIEDKLKQFRQAAGRVTETGFKGS